MVSNATAWEKAAVVLAQNTKPDEEKKLLCSYGEEKCDIGSREE